MIGKVEIDRRLQWAARLDRTVLSDLCAEVGELAVDTQALRQLTLHEIQVPPNIVVESVRSDGARTIIAFEVKDDFSPVQRVEFSQDGGQRWLGVFPKDGIADSKDEHYELVIDGELGERGLTLRANDSMNNLAMAHVDAPRKR